MIQNAKSRDTIESRVKCAARNRPYVFISYIPQLSNYILILTLQGNWVQNLTRWIVRGKERSDARDKLLQLRSYVPKW